MFLILPLRAQEPGSDHNQSSTHWEERMAGKEYYHDVYYAEPAGRCRSRFSDCALVGFTQRRDFGTDGGMRNSCD